MFSGIVQGTGKVKGIEKYGNNVRLSVDFGKAAGEIRQGDSVSINGVCLSAVTVSGRTAAFDAIAETLRMTNLGELQKGSMVNYETSISANDIIGGHLVTGHIDGTGRISSIDDEDGSLKMVLSVERKIGSMVLEKGLVAIDGMSLTPADVRDRRFTLYLIPDTLRKTTISGKRVGDRVNIELDLFGKYISKFVANQLASIGKRK